MQRRHTLIAQRQLLLVTVLVGAVTVARPSCAAITASPIKAWSDVLQGAIRDNSLASQIANKYLGLLGQAIHNALQQNQARSGGANETAVVAFAAHTFLTTWFPWRFATHDLLISAQLAGLSGDELDKAEAIGAAAANNVSATRIGDGFAKWSRFKPAPNGSIGEYQATPNYTTAVYPQFGFSKPLLLAEDDVVSISDNYTKRGKAILFTDRYYTDLEYTRAVGEAGNGTNRTEYQTKSAPFWADGAKTHTVGLHLLNASWQVLPDDLSLAEQAKFLARYGVALADASLVGYRTKYSALLWRPVTAIREGDNNSRYDPDPEWTPLLLTPLHPSFPSGHQLTAGAALVVLRAYVDDAVNVSLPSEGLPDDPPRNYTSLTAIIDELGASRVFGGVHFRYEIEEGELLAEEVTKKVLDLIP